MPRMPAFRSDPALTGQGLCSRLSISPPQTMERQLAAADLLAHDATGDTTQDQHLNQNRAAQPASTDRHCSTGVSQAVFPRQKARRRKAPPARRGEKHFSPLSYNSSNRLFKIPRLFAQAANFLAPCSSPLFNTQPITETIELFKGMLNHLGECRIKILS